MVKLEVVKRQTILGRKQVPEWTVLLRRDMEIDLSEVLWQESDAKVWNALDQYLETAAEDFPLDKEEKEDVKVRDGGHVVMNMMMRNRCRWRVAKNATDRWHTW